MKVKIVGTGSAVPEKCVTNDDLSQWMDTSDEWIRSRTGIETRHLAVRETTTEMAVEAAKCLDQLLFCRVLLKLYEHRRSVTV